MDGYGNQGSCCFRLSAGPGASFLSSLGLSLYICVTGAWVGWCLRVPRRLAWAWVELTGPRPRPRRLLEKSCADLALIPRL